MVRFATIEVVPSEGRVNSSRTWKSGEVARISGTYVCENCRLAGRELNLEIEAGKVFPMCSSCPEKDVTWRLIRAAPAVRATA
jgi:hypothetical protein